MTYKPHIKVSYIGEFHGAAGNAYETWTLATRWAPVDGNVVIADVGQAQSNAVAASCIPAAATFFSSGRLQSNVRLTEIRTYVIGPDGKAVGSIGYAPLDTPAIGSAQVNAPPQVALAISLYATGRGKGAHGRFFLPTPRTFVQDDGRMSSADADSMLAGVTTWLDDTDSALGDSLTQDVELVVAGATGAGTLRPVRTIRVGHVFDTQRRRRRAMAEAYTEGPYGT